MPAVLAPYRELLSTPGGKVFSGAAFVARMPIAMIGLGIVLLVVSEEDRYGLAGAVSATFALVNAVAAPVIARLIDRLGQTRVLVPAVALYAGFLSLFVVLVTPRRTAVDLLPDVRRPPGSSRRRSARWSGRAGATCSGRAPG